MGDAVDGCHNAPASVPAEPPSDDDPLELDPLPLELDPVPPDPLPEPDEPPEPEPAREFDDDPEPDVSATPPLSSCASAEPEDPHATGEMKATTETSRASRAVIRGDMHQVVGDIWRVAGDIRGVTAAPEGAGC
jgi:hypothetical protein